MLDAREKLGLPEDYEDGVVPREGAQNFGPFLPIESFRDGLCATGQSPHEQEISGALGAGVEGGQQPGEGRSVLPRFGGEGVMGDAFRIGDFDQAKLPDVAGERGLGDVEAALGEELTKVLLAGDALLAHDRAHGSVSLGFAHGGRGCR